MKRQVILILAVVFICGLTPILVGASTVIEGPGYTEVTDSTGDLQLQNCDTSNVDRPCSLAPTAPLSSPDYTDITSARIEALPGGLVKMTINLNGAVPETPSFSFLAYGWSLENGCVNSQPGPTDKDGIRVIWNGTSWAGRWQVVTSCKPREVEQGPSVAFNFSPDRKAVSAQVDMCDLVSRAGDSLLWHAGARRLPFEHPIFTRTHPVDAAPDVSAFNPDPPPEVINPEPAARWQSGCVKIDIKPGSFPNSIYPANDGSIPVAIFSTASFNAPNRLDQANLFFGQTGDEDSLIFCSGAEDVNGDGLPDLVCHFDTQLTGFYKGDTQGILKALTNDTVPLFILARDSVRIVPK